MIHFENGFFDEIRPILLPQPKKHFSRFSLPEYKTPLVSIIIPAYNQFPFTYNCIKAVATHTKISYEVILADDCSTDETKNISQIIKNVVHIRTETNLRFVRNCNYAARFAKGQYLFFLNNDTQIQPDCLESLLALIEKDERIGITGSKLIYPDGMIQEAGSIIWKDGSGWNYGYGNFSNSPEYNYVRDVDYLSGAAMLIRKSIWDTLGGFDELYAPAYYDDIDIAFAVRELGFRTVFQPKSIVVHFEGVSNGLTLNSGQKQFQVVNSVKFYNKWKDVLHRDQFDRCHDFFWARDRSFGKKVILFIDDSVSAFDKHAGARNTFMYLKLFCEQGFHIIFLPDSFAAVQPYTDILQQMGIMVLYGPLYRQNWLLWFAENGKYIDYVYLNRPEISAKYIDAVKATNAKIIYHGHDLHYIRLMAQYKIENDETLRDKAVSIENIERSICSSADVILTVSDKEKTILQKIAPNKPVILIPIFFFDSFPFVKPFNSRHNLLFVGGFAHLPNVDGILWFVNTVMPLLPSLQLTIVGSNPPRSVKALASDHITITGYVSDDKLLSFYSSSKVAIIPLRYGAGVKGKTIEAMGNMIPIVSTSFGTEGLPEITEIVPANDDPESFAERVMFFLNNDTACEKMVEGYTSWLKRHFSKQKALEALSEMIK
jgi:GT2 family glycosyltransferase